MRSICRPLILPLAAGLMLGLVAPTAASSLIINDTFDDASYSGEGAGGGKDPNTGTGDGRAWYLLNYNNFDVATPVFNVDNGFLNLTSGRVGPVGPINHFDAHTLSNVGDSLTFTVSVAASDIANANNGFVLGLANSGGYQFTENVNNSVTVPGGGTWDAYAISFPTGSNEVGRVLETNEDMDDEALFADATRLQTPPATRVPGAGVGPTAKDFVLKLEREDDGLRISGMSGDSAFGDITVDEPITWTFDTATINFHNSQPTAQIGSVKLEYLAAEPDILVGDMNFDGVIDTADVAPFVQALTDPSGYQSAFDVDEAMMIAAGDINDDGAFDTADVAPFVQLLVGGNSAASVPEPTTGLLLVGGALLLARRRR